MPFKVSNTDIYNEIDQSEKPEIQLSVSDIYEPPTTGEVFGAVFRKENSLVSFAANSSTVPLNFIPEDGYDPFIRDTQGYEMFSQEFEESVSPEHTEAIKARIEQEFSDRRVLEDAGALGVVAQMAAGVTDPIFMVLQAMGIGTFRLAGSVLKTAGKMTAAGAFSETVAEVSKHSTQSTRSVEESVMNVGGAALISGVLGGTVQGVKNLKKTTKKIEQNLLTTVDDDISSRFKEGDSFVITDEIEGMFNKDTATKKISLADVSPTQRQIDKSRVLAVPLDGKNIEIAKINGELFINDGHHTAQKFIDQGFTEVDAKFIDTDALGGKDIPITARKPTSQVAINGDFQQSTSNFDLVNAGKIQQWGVSPLVRTSTSESLETKQLVNAMMETPLVTKGNVEGIATSPIGGTVETRIKMWDAPLVESLNKLDDSYTKYRQGQGSLRRGLNDYVLRNRGSKLSKFEFREAVGSAMRRGDVSDIPEVTEAAGFLRSKVYEPLKNKAIELKLLPEDVDVKTAVSYLSRVYKHKKIIAERDKWDAIVGDWFKEQRATALIKDVGGKTAKMSDSDITDLVNRTTNRILGTSSTRTAYDIKVGKKGVFKERSFTIPDELIEDFLESDVDMLTRRMIKTMSPDIEIKAQFGDVELKSQISAIKKSWDKKINKAKSAKQRDKFTKRQKADVEDITAMRDRLRGTYKMPADPDNFFVRAGRSVRDINFLRMLGGMTLSAIPDLARPIAVNGLKPVSKQLMKLALSPRKFKLATAEARKAAVGLDMVLNTRATSLAEIADVYGRRTRFERGLQGTSEAFSKISLMSQWNSAIKQFSGVVTSDRLVSESIKLAGGKASKNSIRRLAQAGIDKKVAKRIAKEFSTHGDDGTVKLINGDNWTDTEALETFRAAVLRDVDRTIVTPGKGEAPLWTSSEMGKMVFQFKTFASSAHHKILLADLQHRDAAALNGFLLSVALGTLSYGAKQFVAGREISKDPSKVIVESLDRSGVFGYMWDINNVIEKGTRGNIGASPLLGAPPMSRYASRNVVGALAGPSLGTATDIIDVGGAVFSGDFKQRDVKTMRKLLPFQNLFYTRQLLNQLEEKTARRFPK